MSLWEHGLQVSSVLVVHIGKLTNLVDKQDNLSSSLLDEILDKFTPSTSNIPRINNLNNNIRLVQNFLQSSQGGIDQLGNIDILLFLYDRSSSLGFGTARDGCVVD
jgi:hypothetical protein